MIFKSKFPDVEIPDQSLPDFVLGKMAELGDRAAFIDGPSGRTLTYDQVAQGIRRVAASLAKRGFGPGDTFAIYSPNVPEYALAFLGTAAAGGTCTTANPLYTPDELAFQITDSGARYLLTVPPLLEAAKAGAEKSGRIDEIFVFGEAEGATPFAALLASDPADAPGGDCDPANDVVALPYSSGTTGKPKGVMLTHRNLVANICQIEDLDDVDDHETLIGVLPFFHSYGMTVIMAASLCRGSTVVTMPRFDLEGFCGLIQKHRVTVGFVVPPILVGLAKHPVVDQYDLSSLKFLNSGAAPLGEDLAVAVKQRIGCVVKQGYGLTETSPVTHTTPFEEGAEVKVEAVGVAIPNTECKILDLETGEEVGPNTQGELYIRGPQVMKGYLNNEEATDECLDADGWLRTGDVATVDDDGDYRIHDRLKEFIKYKGFQVAPAELEDYLMGHPSVADAAVVPSPDEEAGEVPKGFVVLKPGALDGRPADQVAADIQSYIAAKVAPHKKLRLVEFIDEVPKSASGKILRRFLVERERERVRAEQGG
ncbi:MAG TPA: AMP-binding protein [Thermoanaerobaculia bacterium]|nr:AMP-binding protein [Thermoanaerobaculia bacterium]